MLDPKDIDFVIYHGPGCTDGCTDGFMSAVSVMLYVNNSKEVTYLPAQYDSIPPDVSGKNVLICDFSYKYNVITDMIKKANKLLIIDHHVTSAENLKDINPLNKIFDINHSGAYLTWKYLFGQEKIPKLVQYVEDYDLWKFELPHSKKVNIYIGSQQHTYHSFYQMLNYFNKIESGETSIDSIVEYGTNVMEMEQKLIDSILELVTFDRIEHESQILTYGIVKSDVLKSEIGNAMMVRFKDIDFAAVYSHDLAKNKTRISLRSSNEKANVEKIAIRFGGGGHRNASGIIIDGFIDNLPSL